MQIPVLRSFLVPTALVACALASACVIASDSDTSVSGRYVSETTLAAIEPGKTSDYAMAILGEPSQKSVLKDGVEIWQWHYTKRTASDTAVIFLVAAENNTTTQHTTYVEFKDGVVVKAWRD